MLSFVFDQDCLSGQIYAMSIVVLSSGLQDSGESKVETNYLSLSVE